MHHYKLIALGVIMIAILIIITGITLLSYSPILINNSISQSSKLIRGNVDYNNWLQFPDPVYKEIYVWNIIKYDINQKITVKEIGPFVYREYKKKINVTTYDGHITYEEVKWYTFDSEKSLGNFESMSIRTLNIPLVTLIEKLRYTPNSNSSLLFEQPLLKTLTVKELLWGYNDTDMSILTNQSLFGLFVKNNYNYSTDGIFDIYDGTDNIEQVGEIYKWNTKRQLNYWYSEYSNSLNGTDGTIFPRNLKEEIFYFSTEMCRLIPLTHFKDSNVKGITSKVYRQEKNTFNKIYMKSKGFCNEKCYHGIMNVSICKGVPMFVSNPHFYLAPVYHGRIIGMKGNSSLLSNFHLEQETSTLLRMEKKIQINFYYNYSTLNSNLTRENFTVMPIVWINEYTEISQHRITEMYTKMYGTKKIIYTVAVFLIVVAVISLSLIGSAYGYKRYRMYKDNQDMNSLIPSDTI